MNLDRGAEVLSKATRHVFSTMLGSEPNPREAYEAHGMLPQSDVTGMIGLAGEAAASLSLHCSTEQARTFAARLLGMEPDCEVCEEDVRDAIGEVVNMIAGDIKTALASEHQLNLALPSVLIGEKCEVQVKSPAIFVVPFDDPAGSFAMAFVLEGDSAG